MAKISKRETTNRIELAVDKVKNLLMNPANIFAKGTAVDNLTARIDDKLMRIRNKGINDKTKDTIDDLIGYLVLLKLALQDEEESK